MHHILLLRLVDAVDQEVVVEGVAYRGERTKKTLGEYRHGLVVEVERAVVEGGEQQCEVFSAECCRLRLFLACRQFLTSIEQVVFLLLVDRYHIGGVGSENGSLLSSLPHPPCEVARAHIGEIYLLCLAHLCPISFAVGYVVDDAVLSDALHEFECGVLARKNEDVGDDGVLLFEFDLESDLCSRLDMILLCAISYRRHLECGTTGIVGTQQEDPFGIGGSAYLSTLIMDVDVFDGQARSLVDDVTHHYGFGG